MVGGYCVSPIRGTELSSLQTQISVVTGLRSGYCGNHNKKVDPMQIDINDGLPPTSGINYKGQPDKKQREGRVVDI